MLIEIKVNEADEFHLKSVSVIQPSHYLENMLSTNP
jgi:hypothetical protein